MISVPTSIPTSQAEELPFVSVVMPVRNEAAFIQRSVKTLLDQDYPQDRMEIVVADGLSDDGTREILARIAADHPNVIVIDNPGKIVPTGLNLAVEAARGAVIIRVDGHCELDTSFVRQSVAVLRERPEAWSVGGPIRHAARGAMGEAIAIAMSHPLGVGNAAHRYPDYEGYAEGAQFPTIHRWVFDRIGMFDEQLARNQDDEFNYRINQAGGKVFVSPRIRYTYYVRENLRQLFRQYFQYGFWRIPVMKKHGRPTTLRQLAPPIFYTMILVIAILGLVLKNPIVALALPLSYLAVMFALGLRTAMREGFAIGLRVPAAIITMHSAYAYGMIYGWLTSLVNPGAWSPSGRHTVLSR